MRLTSSDISYLGACLEGFFCGLYSGIFAMFLQHHGSDKGKDKKDILFFAICGLYVASLATFIFDTATFVLLTGTVPTSRLYGLGVASATIFGCCDLVSQAILVYRCWIVWGRNIHVVIVPSILALAFLAIWLSTIGAWRVLQGRIVTTDWGTTLNVTGLAVSMTVNALAMGLIVLRIFKVFREVKPTMTSNEQTLDPTGGRKLQSVIFVLIESGMALFSIQLARLVVTILGTEAADNAFDIIGTVHEMLNGITPTIILVRVSMGLSFHDEKSMVEVTSSLRFIPTDSNSIPGVGSIGSVHQGKIDDGVDVQPSDDIQMVDVEAP